MFAFFTKMYLCADKALNSFDGSSESLFSLCLKTNLRIFSIVCGTLNKQYYGLPNSNYVKREFEISKNERYFTAGNF